MASQRSSSWVSCRQALDAHHQRVAQRRRQRPAAVEAGGQQLLGEERVALAAGVQALDQRRLGLAAEDVRELQRQLLARERLQLDVAGWWGRASARPAAGAADGGGAARRCDRCRRSAAARRRACARGSVTKARVELSAQCMSSISSSTGCCSPSASSSASSASKTRAWVGSRSPRRLVEAGQQRREVGAHLRRTAAPAPGRGRARAGAGRRSGGNREARSFRDRRTRPPARARPRRGRGGSARPRDETFRRPTHPLRRRGRGGRRPRRRSAASSSASSAERPTKPALLTLAVMALESSQPTSGASGELVGAGLLMEGEEEAVHGSDSWTFGDTTMSLGYARSPAIGHSQRPRGRDPLAGLSHPLAPPRARVSSASASAQSGAMSNSSMPRRIHHDRVGHEALDDRLARRPCRPASRARSSARTAAATAAAPAAAGAGARRAPSAIGRAARRR